MNNLRRFITVLALLVTVILAPKLTVQASGNLPQSTPVWFDAEYYASTYPDVYAIYGSDAAKYGGFDSAMWFHYKNCGVYENRKPAASPDWFDAAYYASTYPDVAAVYGSSAEKLFQHYILLGRSEQRRPNATYVHTIDKNGNLTGATPSAPTAVTTAASQTTVQQTTATATEATGTYFPTGIKSNGSPYYIIVDRTYNVCNVFTVGNDGTYCQLVRSMLCSTGRAGHGTPAGTFTIYEHTAGGGWCYMADGTWAIWGMRFRTGGYMFHSVCFAKKYDPYPIPEEVAALGSKASLGCVRLSVDDAMWLYNTVPDGTLVTIGN